MTKREKIDEATLEQIAREFVANSLGGPGSEVSAARERNLRAYNGLPEGEFAPVEIEDRSQFVSTDVADTVDGMIPQILDVFVTDDKAVECEPTKPGPESAATAKQATGYLNHLFYVRNDGLNVLHDWLQDASLQKVGFVKVWAEEDAQDAKQTFEGQTEDQLAAILQDGAQLESEPQVDDKGLTFTVIDQSRRIKFCVACVPPHEMRIDSNAKWGGDYAGIGEVRQKRRFELEEMGYDLEGIGESGGQQSEVSAEAMLAVGETFSDNDPELHESHKLYEYAELYFQLDVDGDGVAEWVQVCTINGTLVHHEKVDGDPYAEICLMPRAHAFFGDCPADRAYGIQKEQTNLSRSLIDNVYFATNQRTYINTLRNVNIADLLDNRPGGAVRGEGPPGEAFAPIPTMPIPQTAWQLQEMLSVRLENRTGFTRYSQGMDADSLNKTATGVSIITQKADIRLRLMTRFAAQGVRKMFSKLLKLAVKHQDQQDWFNVNGEWIPVQPNEWRDQFNIKINVGLGHGTKDQQAQRIMGMVPLQQMGVQMGVVQPKHVANTIRMFAAVSEFKNPDEFCDQEPSGMPNPEQFAQMKAETEQHVQGLTEENQQIKEENAHLKLANANKQAEYELKAHEAMKPDAQVAPEDNSPEWAKLEIERYKAITDRMAMLATAQADAAALEAEAVGEMEAEGSTSPQPSPLQAALEGIMAVQAQLTQAVAMLAQPKSKVMEIVGPSGQVYRGQSAES